MQKGVRYNEGHALYLSVVARKEGTKRGFLCKKSAENSRWTEKFFALHQNVLFYFDGEQSARPTGIYLLEGCTCERTPAPKVPAVSKEPVEKQQVGPVLRFSWWDAEKLGGVWSRIMAVFISLFFLVQSYILPKLGRSAENDTFSPLFTSSCINAEGKKNVFSLHGETNALLHLPHVRSWIKTEEHTPQPQCIL